MVAGVLRILGFDLGSDIDEDNNEDRTFLAHGGDRRVFVESQFAARKLEYLQRIKQYIASRNSSGTIWGWKDPLAGYYIEEVRHELRDPAYIFVARDPIAIAIRERFEEKSQAPGALLAYILNAIADYERIAHFLTGPKSALLVSYERALRHPQTTVSALQSFLMAPPNANAEQRARKFIQPDRGPARIDP